MKFFLLVASLTAARHVKSQTYPITGVSAGVDPNTGARPFRYNINDFQHAGPAWDLYIQAMQSFIADDVDDLLSYFQIAGIHGYPNVPWDGVVGNGSGVGYCTHNSILFPTWHRPYMALFEQVVWNKSQIIAQQYPDGQRDTYLAAAETLRVPYWDWSMQADMPAVVNIPTVSINTPSGQQTVSNPLYSYIFPASTLSDFGNQLDFNVTVRRPALNGTSQPALVNQQLTSMASSLHTQAYNLWTQAYDYPRFADASVTNKFHMHFNSIEGMHNTIHTTVGGARGQMGIISVAAFDPIFWLHHANVDRVFAIWQAVNPTMYTVPYAAAMPSYSTPQGTMEDVNYPLYPFHFDTQGSLYNSAEVRNLSDFGYSYPEIQDWALSNQSLQANVTAIINGMYNNGKLASTTKRTAVDNYNWMINTATDTSLLSDSVFVYFYISTPPSNPAIWESDPNVFAIMPILVNDMSGTVTASQTVVSEALESLVADLNPSVVLPVLQSKLQWRATWSNGTAIPAEQMKAIGAVDILLTGQTVQQNANIEEFPTYGDVVLHAQAYLGSNGGDVLS